MTTLILMTVLFGLPALFCHYWAKSHGKQPAFWGVMGLLFGPLAIPAVLLAAHR